METSKQNHGGQVKQHNNNNHQNNNNNNRNKGKGKGGGNNNNNNNRNNQNNNKGGQQNKQTNQNNQGGNRQGNNNNNNKGGNNNKGNPRWRNNRNKNNRQVGPAGNNNNNNNNGAKQGGSNFHFEVGTGANQSQASGSTQNTPNKSNRNQRRNNNRGKGKQGGNQNRNYQGNNQGNYQGGNNRPNFHSNTPNHIQVHGNFHQIGGAGSFQTEDASIASGMTNSIAGSVGSYSTNGRGRRKNNRFRNKRGKNPQGGNNYNNNNNRNHFEIQQPQQNNKVQATTYQNNNNNNAGNNYQYEVQPAPSISEQSQAGGSAIVHHYEIAPQAPLPSSQDEDKIALKEMKEELEATKAKLEKTESELSSLKLLLETEREAKKLVDHELKAERALRQLQFELNDPDMSWEGSDEIAAKLMLQLEQAKSKIRELEAEKTTKEVSTPKAGNLHSGGGTTNILADIAASTSQDERAEVSISGDDSINMASFDNEEKREAEFKKISSVYGMDDVLIEDARITRFLQLQVHDKDIVGVELVLNIPEKYPESGTPDAVAEVTKYYCGGKEAKEIVERHLPSLSTLCTFEAKANEGQDALMNVLTSADSWVKNDWPALQQKEKEQPQVQETGSPSRENEGGKRRRT